MPGNFWENDQQVQPAAQPSQGGPRPIISVPDLDKQADNSRADAQLGLSQTQTDIALRNEQDSNVKDSIANAQTLKSGYEQLAPVREYRVALPALMTAIDLPADANGDATLVYQYVKTMDPGGAVMEGDTQRVQGTGNYYDNAVSSLKKQLGIEGGGLLSPTQRANLKRDMLSRVQTLGRAYRQQRQRYSADAQAFGIEPERVIGPDDVETHLPRLTAWLEGQQKQGATGAAGGGVRDPEMRGGLPTGTDIEFGMDAQEKPFDRERWLLENQGINSDQEARYLAFFNQNSGNPNLSVDAAKQWFAASGINAPSDADLSKLVEDVRKGGKVGPIDTSGAEQAYRDGLRASLQREGFDPTSGGAYAARAARGLEFGLSDEIEGIGGGIDALLSNEGVADGYRLARDRSREAFEQMEQNQGALGTAAELAGGLVGGGLGATRGAMTAGRAAREGAAMGGIAGFGYGEGAQDSLIGAAGGAAVGGGAGYALGRGAEALAARRAAATPTAGSEVIGAADALNSRFGTNIAPLPADVAGAATRRATGAAAQLPLAAGSIVRGAARVSDEAKAARDGIAALTGTATTSDAAGDAAVRGAESYMKRSKTKVDALYAKARTLGGSDPVDLAEARTVLDQNIADLSATPGGAPGLARLEALRSTLDQPYPVEGVKRMRTTLRDEFIGEGLRGSDLERRVGQVLDAADLDITNSLSAAGKGDAVRAYQAAAAAHKERVGIIDDVLTPFIGKKGEKSVEDVMKAIDTATKTKGARLGRFLSSIPPEDAGTVRATIISRLGKSSAGTQDAAGEAFSLPQFLTHWNQMSGKAKGELFGGEVRAALDNLAKVAEGSKEAQRYANFSNTGSVVGQVATYGGGASGMAIAPISTTLAVAAQFGAGKLLASPSFARWLAKMPSSPGLIEKHVGALSRIAANDNVIAQEAIGLQASLREALGAGAGRAAAAPELQKERTQQGEPR